jgi:hypothetical protein
VSLIPCLTIESLAVKASCFFPQTSSMLITSPLADANSLPEGLTGYVSDTVEVNVWEFTVPVTIASTIAKAIFKERIFVAILIS